MSKHRIIELVLEAEAVTPNQAVLPAEATGPTLIEITPEYATSNSGQRVVTFRVKFKPDNTQRRAQPYRQIARPIFPNNWKYGDPWPSCSDA